jgi:hypothetical protein
VSKPIEPVKSLTLATPSPVASSPVRAIGKPAHAAVAAPKRDCDPNFYFDAQGEKHFKPECFR